MMIMVNWKKIIYIAVVFLCCSFIVLLPFMFGNLMWFIMNLPWIILFGLVISAFSCFVLAPCFIKTSEASNVPHEFIQVLEDVSLRAGLKKAPKLRVVNSPEVNAIAYSSILGSRVAITSGLIEQYTLGKLSIDDVKAIFAHEVSHIKSFHPFKGAIATSIVSVTDVFSSLLIIAGPLIIAEGYRRESFLVTLMGLCCLGFGGILKILSKVASIISFHYLRSLEYEADADGAKIVTREQMASMLKKIEEINMGITSQTKLFMPEKWTVPTKNRSWFERLFDTHPPTEKRIRKLLESI